MQRFLNWAGNWRIRRCVAALWTAVALSLIAVGCGGGEDSTSGASTRATTPQAVPSDAAKADSSPGSKPDADSGQEPQGQNEPRQTTQANTKSDGQAKAGERPAKPAGKTLSAADDHASSSPSGSTAQQPANTPQGSSDASHQKEEARAQASPPPKQGSDSH
jgi:hypothetical protein